MFAEPKQPLYAVNKSNLQNYQEGFIGRIKPETVKLGAQLMFRLTQSPQLSKEVVLKENQNSNATILSAKIGERNGCQCHKFRSAND